MNDYLLKLQKNKENKLKLKKESYNKIFNLLNKKIIFNIENNMKDCYLNVPPFILGIPPYKIDSCCKYIISKLKKKGLENSIYIEPNIIYINWEHLL